MREWRPGRQGPPTRQAFRTSVQRAFVNTAEAAGLRAPVVFGGIEHNDYILESMGCGAAFVDYDNDGWLDILVLTGQRARSHAARGHLRLYKNNRDGTFTDVTAQVRTGPRRLGLRRHRRRLQ